MRAKVLPLKTEENFCGPCSKPKCEICKHITKTNQFESSSTKHIHSVRPQNLNCASKNVVYLFSYNTCHKQYTENTEEIWSRFNCYRYLHWNFSRNKKVNQVPFYAHFAEGLHQEESNGKVRLIDQVVSVDGLRREAGYISAEWIKRV